MEIYIIQRNHKINWSQNTATPGLFGVKGICVKTQWLISSVGFCRGSRIKCRESRVKCQESRVKCRE